MRYILTFTIWLLVAVLPVFSAVISGMVKDSVTGKPLVSASVFIAGTTFGTNTQPDGSFMLNYTPSGASQLVVAHLGYQTYSKNASEISTAEPLLVNLPVKAMQLSTVSVYGHDSNRKKNMAEFLFGFFGDSEFGKACTILNPNVLHLMRKPIPGKIAQDELQVSADSDLYIENKLLGYTIRYTLENFVQTTYSCTFKGYPFFTDNLSKSKNKERTLAYRERAYLGSQMHFFRSLFNKSLDADGFKVFQVDYVFNFPIDGSHYGLMADTIFITKPDEHMVQTEKPLDMYKNMFVMDKAAAIKYERPFEVRYTLNGEDKAYGRRNLYYNGMTRSVGQQISIVKLENENVVFFPTGACKNAGSLITIGYWSFKKAGDILPWDYQPSKTAKQVVTLQKMP